ncbi:uncharacterized protein EDB91DRAFT_1164197 [Suillus paluster]|uniref:uncharacterized protein n=1 Tax=Suillus paluster TaxID=48578 RepID=UPI001B886FDC|nr:uncharacterized protein EDB91DRAFT_1164197 [Suillus paluster]KAG1727385.1 hypothetical protein EDB91DRAFT_1164197 [Suillus paluster]
MNWLFLRLIFACLFSTRIAYEWTEDSVIKYLWSAAGYELIAVPLIITKKHHHPRVADGEDKGGESGEGRK